MHLKLLFVHCIQAIYLNAHGHISSSSLSTKIKPESEHCYSNYPLKPNKGWTFHWGQKRKLIGVFGVTFGGSHVVHLYIQSLWVLHRDCAISPQLHYSLPLLCLFTQNKTMLPWCHPIVEFYIASCCSAARFIYISSWDALVTIFFTDSNDRFVCDLPVPIFQFPFFKTTIIVSICKQKSTFVQHKMSFSLKKLFDWLKQL